VDLDDRILKLSAAVSSALHGRLHSVHAYESEPVGLYPTDALDPATAQELNIKLRAAAQERYRRALRGSALRGAPQHLVDAPPTRGIVQTAREIGADLVVLGAVSRSGLDDVLTGNTAEQLLDRLSCDLLIVKPAHFKSRIARAQAGVRLIPATLPM
jgi:universal stress protein E